MLYGTVRRFLVAITVLVVLSAWGAQEVQPPPSPSPAGTPSPAPADNTSPSPEAIHPRTGATRTVGHTMGTTEVPANPQHVVVPDTGELDSMLAPVVTPVGSMEIRS